MDALVEEGLDGWMHESLCLYVAQLLEGTKLV